MRKSPLFLLVLGTKAYFFPFVKKQHKKTTKYRKVKKNPLKLCEEKAPALKAMRTRAYQFLKFCFLRI